MHKEEFLTRVAKGLAGLPQEDIDRWVDYYKEMLDDRMEDGVPEEAAVSMMGDPDEVVARIVAETPLPRLIKARVEPIRRRPAWVIVLLVLGAPLWLPLLFAAFCVLLSVYVTLWSVVLALCATAAGLALGGLGMAAGSFVMIAAGSPAQFALFLGAALIAMGAGVLLCLSLGKLIKGILKCSKAVLTGVKSLFMGKGASV